MAERISEANRLAAIFQAKADEIRKSIIQYIGCEIKESDGVYVLHSNNDMGVLYWHRKGQKRLYTIRGYRYTDLPKLFPEITNRKERKK